MLRRDVISVNLSNLSPAIHSLVRNYATFMLLILVICTVRSATGVELENFSDGDWPNVFWKTFFAADFPTGDAAQPTVKFCEAPDSTDLKVEIVDQLDEVRFKHVRDCMKLFDAKDQENILSQGIIRNSVIPWTRKLCKLTLPSVYTKLSRSGSAAIQESPCEMYPAYPVDQELRIFFMRTGYQHAVPVTFSATTATNNAVNISIYEATSVAHTTWTVAVVKKVDDPVRSIYYIFQKIHWLTVCEQAGIQHTAKVRIMQAVRPPNPDYITTAYVQQDCLRPKPIKPLADVVDHTDVNNVNNVNTSATELTEEEKKQGRRMIIFQQRETVLRKWSESAVLYTLGSMTLVGLPLGVVYMNWPNRNCF